jgi:predicted CoA-binding protein
MDSFLSNGLVISDHLTRLMRMEIRSNSSKTTLVMGASENPSRYSFLAVNRLVSNHIPVIAVGTKTGQIGNVMITTDLPENIEIDTITLYVGPDRLTPEFSKLLALNPRRIIFNPGTEDTHLMKEASARGILVEEACTLVMLASGVY